MNKELTPLQALENLKNLSHDVQYASKIPSIDNELKIIETELKEYKKIEDKLGIDLITLFKLIDALYVYSYGHTDIVRCLNDGISLYDKSITIYNGTCVVSYPLSEYGKSFALTKEELL